MARIRGQIPGQSHKSCQIHQSNNSATEYYTHAMVQASGSEHCPQTSREQKHYPPSICSTYLMCSNDPAIATSVAA